MNLKTLLLVLLLVLVAIFAFVCILLTTGEKHASCDDRSQAFLEHLQSEWNWLFADLTEEEMVHVVQYLKSSLGAVLEDASHASPSDNCIYSIDLHLPPKAESLLFLDHGGSRPPRQALAVVYYGNQPDPNVTEYVVGPLPEPVYHRDVTVQKYGGQVPYYRRPPLVAEYKQMAHFLRRAVFPTAPSFMKDVLHYDGTNLAAMTTSPRGLESGDRATWLVLFQNVTGYFLHPVGLEVLLDHSSLDISHWTVKEVFYNGQYYRDLAQLEREFTEGHVRVEKVKKVPVDGDFSSMKPRVHHAEPGPLNYELYGPRYSVRKNQVHSSSWSFAFRMDVSRGPHLFDIRFKGQRVVYELSVQDTMSIYGSSNPGGMSTRYMDASFGIGRLMNPLVRGVDCPYSAAYLNAYFLAEAERPVTTRDAICVFEQDTGAPLRRHYSNLQSLYYGGLPGTALVFRSVTTIGNYDYIWDFMFYPNGAIESKVRATGYISSSFLYGDGLNYGNKVGDHTLGTIHTHFIGYKVDLDVAGVKNSLLANDMTFETVKVPWSPDREILQMKMVKKVLDTEDKAAFRLHDNMPRYIYFASDSTNKWGHKQGYRIQSISFAGDHLPESDSMERAVSWGRYKLAVTKRKEEEPFSTSIYNQNDPWTPSVAFADFIDNETIVNEDLVAWITTGFLHIPHAEDIPNTVTLGNAVGFLLRPYNYFDDDPSIYSPDSVFFTSEQDPTSCDVNHIACLPKTAACVPSLPPFTYEGFQNMTRL
ncbi:membrane primary amine oxidase-like isoform X2 [Elgaria multicarinata webbii]|uniref:membrane primary amine oxidase-like isoform X2 n=1 Tax=Elgaria multicarinata webbii TaxID=159646 RepID=UPI002FCD48F8